MNKPIIIPGVNGGLANSLYEDLTRQTYQSCQDLAVYDDINIITPVYPAFTDVALPSGTTVNPRNFLKASNGNYYFLMTRVISATVNISLQHPNSLGASPSWTEDDVQSPSGNTFYGMDEYKDGLFYSWQQKLRRFGDLSGSPTAATIGTLSNSSETIGDIMSHKGLGRIYFAHGLNGYYNKAGWYDNSTFTEGVLTLGVGLTITNIDQAGAFVLLGVRPIGNSRTSYIVVWNGSAGTIEDIIDVPDVNLQGFRNRGGLLNLVTANIPSSTSQFIQRIYKSGLGGTAQLERELKGINSNAVNPHGVSKSGSGLYIGYQNSNIYNLNSKDKSIPEFLTDLRSLNPTAQLAGNTVIKSIRDTGAEIVVNWTDLTSGVVEKISVTGGAQAYPSTGIYESNIFALNGGLPDKITEIEMLHKAIPANCGFTLYIRHFGNYPWGTTVPSAEAYTELTTPEGSGSSTGKTQSTANAIMTIIKGNEFFKEARYAQIKILFDKVTSSAAPSIVFPIIIR